MDIKEFITKANFYEKEEFMQSLCKVLDRYISCRNCPLEKECHSKENIGLLCYNIFEKYLTIE